MNQDFYSEIQRFREFHIKNVSLNHFNLNELHDEITKLVLANAIKQVSIQYGPLPSSFTFFVMGSAGRFEQSIWSDQDHGIIYQDQSDEVQAYFLVLGKEIAKGLYHAGYPYCDGGVMAGNPQWCKSLSEWKQQLSRWMRESTWESIRYLLIFFDARSIYGEDSYVDELKKYVYQTANQKKLINKALSNTLHQKKGINVLGQLLTETHGPHSGSINIKEAGFFPYVNTIRLLAIKENKLETSTLARIENLSDKWFAAAGKAIVKEQFLKLVNYRLSHCLQTDYDSGHYLPINHLSKEETKEVREIIKHGATLFSYVRKLLEKEDSDGNE